MGKALNRVRLPPEAPPAVARAVAALLAYQPERIILFGSYARGDWDADSDIDLIVVKQSDKRFLERLVEVLGYLPQDLRVDALVYTPQELEAMRAEGNPFIEQALRDGIVLYEKPPGNGAPLAGPGGV